MKKQKRLYLVLLVACAVCLSACHGAKRQAETTAAPTAASTAVIPETPAASAEGESQPGQTDPAATLPAAETTKAPKAAMEISPNTKVIRIQTASGIIYSQSGISFLFPAVRQELFRVPLKRFKAGAGSPPPQKTAGQEQIRYLPIITIPAIM